MTSGRLEFGTLRFGDPDQDWPLNKGFGDRFVDEIVYHLPVDRLAAPVALSIAGLDAYEGTNARIRLEVVDQRAHQFTLRIYTWHDTVLHGLAVTWIRP